MKWMKGNSRKWVDLAVVLLVGGLAIAQTRTKAQLNRQTTKNLHTAMKGEAFAYLKYTLYAEQARKNGHPEIARAFDDAARTERFEHFTEEADLAEFVGTHLQNLQDAIRGESYESTKMYKEFAEQAAAAGDKQAAERFEEIRRDEMKHRPCSRRHWKSCRRLPKLGSELSFDRLHDALGSGVSFHPVRRRRTIPGGPCRAFSCGLIARPTFHTVGYTQKLLPYAFTLNVSTRTPTGFSARYGRVA